MGAEELAQVSETVADAVAGALSPVSDSLAQLAEAPEAGSWVFGEAQYDAVMTLGTSLLVSQVFTLVMCLVLVGCILGYVLTHDWRV